MNPLFLELFVLLLGLALLCTETFAPHFNKKKLAWIGVSGLILILGLTFLPLHPLSGVTASFYTIDGLALFFKRFMLVMTIITLLMGIEFIPSLEASIPGEYPGAGVGEFFILPLFACASLMWLVSAIHFVMLFVSLELLSVILYISISYQRHRLKSLEAGTKYLILGALSAAFLIYGIAWIFGVTGTLTLQGLGAYLQAVPLSMLKPLLFGVAMVLVAFCFKIGAFPFQFWLPDVYQGAPTPITAFLSVASKGAGFVILMRFLEELYTVHFFSKKLIAISVLLSVMTLLFGNLATLAQNNMKRLIAYSSIAHTGYLLMGIASIGTLLAGPAIGFYLVAYLLMSSLSLIILMLVSQASGGDEILHFQGLHQRSPLLAGSMVVAMLSLAGLPLSAGFFGKFFLFEVALEKGHYGLIAVGVITVVAGFYYYLKVIRAMYWQQPQEEVVAIPVSTTMKSLILLLVGAIFFLGVYPAPILHALR